MKKLFIFFALHLFIIVTLSAYLFIDAAFEDRELPPLTYLKKEIYDDTPLKHYLVASGLNTGYGFYGINVATNKYFMVEVLDEQYCISSKIDVCDFETKNSFSRFHTFPSWLYNFKVETNEVKKEADYSRKYVQLRNKFVEKSFNYVGKTYTQGLPPGTRYNVKLITVVPPDIWNTKLKKNNIYVLEEYYFEK